MTQKEKPKCKLIGEDGNIFNLIARTRRTLIENGKLREATEMRERVTSCHSYDEALTIIGEYVVIV